MKRNTKIISLVLAVMMILSMLTACGAKKDASETNKDASSTSETERSYPYTFTDLAGKEITLKQQPKTVYIVGSVQPLVAIYRYYAGNSDNLLGCPEAAQSIISNSAFSEIWPDILKVTPHKDDVNVEEILSLKPDVVFMTGSATGDVYDSLVNAGLTVVSFPTAGSSDDNDTFLAVSNWLTQMGEVFGDKTPSDKLIKYNESVQKDIDSKLADVKESDKPKALIVFQLTNNSLKVAGKGHYSEFWLKHSGGTNAAADIEKLQQVDMEQLQAWDPDIIYLTTFSPVMPEDLYNNKIEGFDFSKLSAVKNKKVYKIPLGSYRWYAPSCECSLMLKWMASKNQPEIFADVDMNKEVAEFLKDFYNFNATDDQINNLLNPTNKSIMSH